MGVRVSTSCRAERAFYLRPASHGGADMVDTVRTGAEVFTSDGERLGVVAELRGDAFRIDSGFLPHYWLRTAAAASLDARSIRLAFPMREFGANLLPAP